MRRIIAISALSVLAVGATGAYLVTSQRPAESMTADLERDLNLATAAQPQRTAVVSAVEQNIPGSPSGTARGKRAVVPTKRRAPRPAPSPVVMEAPQEAGATEPAPAPTVSTEVVASASVDAPTQQAPADPPDNSYPTPASDAGTGGNGSGIQDAGSGQGQGGGYGVGGVVGTVVGAILRGGSAGHDNCEPAGRRRGGIGTSQGTLGTITDILSRGSGGPRGSIPGGRAPMPGRRW